MYGEVNIGLLFQRSIPCHSVLLHTVPWGTCNPFDGLDSNVAFPAYSQDFVEVFSIAVILHHDMIIGQKHSVKTELFERAQVEFRHRYAMTCNADESRQSPIPRRVPGRQPQVLHPAQRRSSSQVLRVGHGSGSYPLDPHAANPASGGFDRMRFVLCVGSFSLRGRMVCHVVESNPPRPVQICHSLQLYRHD